MLLFLGKVIISFQPELDYDVAMGRFSEPIKLFRDILNDDRETNLENRDSIDFKDEVIRPRRGRPKGKKTKRPTFKVSKPKQEVSVHGQES